MMPRCWLSSINSIICFILFYFIFLGLVVMGKLSPVCPAKRNANSLLYCVLNLWQINLIWLISFDSNRKYNVTIGLWLSVSANIAVPSPPILPAYSCTPHTGQYNPHNPENNSSQYNVALPLWQPINMPAWVIIIHCTTLVIGLFTLFHIYMYFLSYSFAMSLVWVIHHQYCHSNTGRSMCAIRKQLKKQQQQIMREHFLYCAIENILVTKSSDKFSSCRETAESSIFAREMSDTYKFIDLNLNVQSVPHRTPTIMITVTKMKQSVIQLWWAFCLVIHLFIHLFNSRH